MKYSTIIFDLSEVLIRGLVGVEKTLSPLLHISERDILSALGNDNLRMLCKGEITEQTYLQNIFTRNDWTISPEDLQCAIRNNFHYTIDGMIPMISRLSTTYNLILHSDHAKEWIQYIKNYHSFLALFTTRIFSFELGLTKDTPEAFGKVLKTINKHADECLFIDDNPQNIQHASCLGITGIHFTNQHTLRSILPMKGITV